jgi:phenylpyruvate tautomerase PptA (4-oxalocrotonate tautomerase family)
MIVIYGIKEKLNPIRSQMSDVIHSCLMSTLGLSEHKRFHRFIPMDKDDFYYSIEDGRTDSYTVLEINLMEGRKKETIKSLIKAIFSEFDKQLGISVTDVEIIIHEQPAHCWGFRGMSGDEAKDLTYKINV